MVASDIFTSGGLAFGSAQRRKTLVKNGNNGRAKTITGE